MESARYGKVFEVLCSQWWTLRVFLDLVTACIQFTDQQARLPYYTS